MKPSSDVTIVDLEVGNLFSVRSAIEFLDFSVMVSSEPEVIATAKRLVLPGVGSFRAAMDKISSSGIDDAIREAVSSRGVNILGICLGMQLLGSGSPEGGTTTGLSLFDGYTDRFDIQNTQAMKIPHVGFDSVQFPEGSALFRRMASGSEFYFVHEYRIKEVHNVTHKSICNYGEDFIAAVEHQNIFATQFHPEKSQTNGLQLLTNFMAQ
jgi:glutamine amidotransferase